MHATRSLLATFVRSPLAWTLAILLPFALGNPAFRSLAVFVAYATIFAFGSLALAAIALAVGYWIGADIFRGYRGPSLWSMLVAVGEWEGRCAARAIDNVLWLADRIYPAGPTGPLGIPACPTCPFGECATCEVVDAPPVLTPALAADIDRVYSILSGRFAGIPTAAVFSPAPSFVALRAPLARLLPSWEEREASVPFGWASTDVDVPASTLRPDTSSEQGPAFDAWRHANRGDRFPLFLAPSTPLLTYRPLTVAPLANVLPDVVADPCDPSDCPLCPATMASGRHEVEPGTWTAERVQICANGPVESHPVLGTMALGTVQRELIEITGPSGPEVVVRGSPEHHAIMADGYLGNPNALPSDSDLDALALSDWPGSETEEAVDEKANALSFADALSGQEGARPDTFRPHMSASELPGDLGDKQEEKAIEVAITLPQIAQDAPEATEPAPEPSSPVDASEEDTMPADLMVGRDRLRKLAKAEGCSYSGKDGADALRAKIRAHRAYR